MKTIVVDTNIILASLIPRHSSLRKTLLLDEGLKLYAPNFLILETFLHKDAIFKKSKLNEDEIYDFLNKILQRINFVSEALISTENAFEGYYLCKETDEKDAPFVLSLIHI